jgi:hypothetical protein
MKITYAQLRYILIPLYVGALVWAILYGYEWVSTYFENQQKEAYKQVPMNLKLKSKPQDVIYSEAYKTASGTDAVKYAYVTGEPPALPNEDIERRTPNSQSIVLDTKIEDKKKIETVKTSFYSKPQMYKKNGEWHQIEYATTTSEVFSMSGAVPYIKRRELAEELIPGERAFALTSTFYPDPDVESTSVDGDVYDYEGGAFGTSLSNACNVALGQARSGVSPFPEDNLTITIVASLTVNGAFDSPGLWTCDGEVAQVFTLFDTSSLPDSASISSATLSLYVVSKINSANDGGDTVNIVSSNPASNVALASGDFNIVGTTLFATAVDITSMSTSAYTTFTLNSSGKAAITATGVSKFGVREGHDIGALNMTANSENSVTFSTAEQTGTSQDPKLDVTYTVVDTFSVGQWFPF